MDSLYNRVILTFLSRSDALEVLGPPIKSAWIDCEGMGDLWGFEYPCGLQIVFQFAHEGTIYGLSFAPDSQRVVSASSDNTLLIWKLKE